MPKLSSETVTLLDGDIRVFKRARSRDLWALQYLRSIESSSNSDYWALI